MYTNNPNVRQRNKCYREVNVWFYWNSGQKHIIPQNTINKSFLEELVFELGLEGWEGFSYKN